MSLDMFQGAIEAGDQAVAASAARDLPAGFGETFDVAWRSGTEFHNSAGYAIARERALDDYRDYVRGKTGEQLPHLGVAQGGELAMYGSDFVSLDDFNAAQAKIAEKNPGLGLQPLTDADLDTMTRRRMAKAHEDAAAMSARETTWGGTAGTVAGVLAGGLSDPVAVATLPLGGLGEAGIALRALEFAAIAGGTEAAIAAASYNTREAALPGSGKEVIGDIAGATLFGGILGAGFAALGKLFKAGDRPMPTAAREDINALTSEAQINAANPFPTVAGSAAARDGLNDAVRSAVRGEPVRAGDNFDPVHVADLDFASAAAADVPDGHVRFYHGWKGDGDPASGGGRWVTSDPIYARDFRRGEGPNNVSYVDIPKGDPVEVAARAWDEIDEAGGTNQIGKYRHVEIPEEWAQRMKPVHSRTEDLAIAGEKHLRPETFGERADVERFDPMPRETDDAASYWESRLADASPEERAALGATDADIPARLGDGETIEGPAIKIGDNIYRGQTHSEALDRAARDVKMSSDEFLHQIEGRDNVGLDGFVTSEGRFLTRREAYAVQDAVERVSAPDLAPAQVAKLADEPATSDAISHNLEHILQANPEAEFTFATKLPDGSTRFDTVKLSDVMKDLDETERAAKEIEACAIGMEAME